MARANSPVETGAYKIGNARGDFVGAQIFCAMGGGCFKAAIAQ